MSKLVQVKFSETKHRALNTMLKLLMILASVFSGIDNIYSHSLPDRFDLSNQQDVGRVKETPIPPIALKEDTAFIRGKVSGYHADLNGHVRIVYENPIMNEGQTFDVKISRDGDFFMDVPILSNATCLFISDYYSEYIVLSPGDTCYLYIDAAKVSEINEFNAVKRDRIDPRYVRFAGAFAEVNNELNASRFWSNNLNLSRLRNKNQPPTQFKKEVLSELEKSLKSVLNDNLSEATKDIMTINLQQIAIRSLLENNNLVNHNFDKGDFSTPVVDMNYFSFLETMNLNSSQAFYGRFYSNIIDQCGQIEERLLSLEELTNKREMPQEALVYEDIQRQKDYLARVLKQNSGPAFDLLEALNYASKIKEDMPLEEEEVEHLKQLQEPVYYHYLKRESELLASHLKEARETSLATLLDVTNKKENYFEDLLSLYAGNVIMLNYWSMGCRPCYVAIDKMEPLKVDYKNRKVVFLYLTDDHFLFPSWRNKSIQIEGVHYRFNKKQIEYVLSKYNLTKATPKFLVFDKKGECIFNREGYSEFILKSMFDTIDEEEEAGTRFSVQAPL